MPRTIIVDAELRPSRELPALVASTHAVAAACPWLAGLPTWAAIVISGLVLCWGGRQVRMIAGLRSRNAITRFRLHGDGRCVVQRRAVETVDAACVGIERLGRWGVVVACREPGKPQARLVMWRDQCDTRSLRRLRIAARWHAGVASLQGFRGPFGESRDLA
jgi:hypothetical protein